MIQKSIPIQKEKGFLSDNEIQRIWKEARLDQPERLIITIDGAPGTGKSILANKIQKIINADGIEAGIVETDLDCLPWNERPTDSSLMDWHNDTISKETIIHPGANLSYTGYNTVTHEKNVTKRIFSPKNGVLILEGLHSIEYARQHTNDTIVAILFRVSNELREINRAERNVRQGRWKASEVASRTKAQRNSAVTYYGDISREIAQTNYNIHNTIRIFP